MSDALTTITNLINSPPGQLAAGGVLGSIVWKFFERVEAVLKDGTKLEIAVWLLGVKVGQKVEPWPDTFAKVFDRVFGEKHLSWKCLWRSTLFAYAGLIMVGVFVDWSYRWQLVTLDYWWDTLQFGFIGNVLPDFVSLLETRYVLGIMQRTTSAVLHFGWVVVDLALTSAISLLTAHLILSVWWPDSPLSWRWSFSAILGHPKDFHQNHSWLSFVIPPFLTSIWLWLYAGSGFILKAARRFDIGFEWFNRKFDIEKKPLQSIGLVAGALVALVYWAAVIVSRLLR
jgi:hypothetical protein